mgnify:CR=1 FL=1
MSFTASNKIATEGTTYHIQTALVYDEENEYYVCEVDLDEDDMVRFLKGDVRACPYYQSDDEYKIVRKQI